MDSFLNQKIVNVIRGGFKSDFLQFTTGDIRQFWGFTGSGTLLGDPPELRKMEEILNFERYVGDDGDLRKYMNLWGRQFVVDSTRLTEILPLTPEQEVAIAEEEQAMVDLIEVLLSYFNSLPIRQLGDPYRNGADEVNDFLVQYNSNHPEIFDQPASIYGGLSNFHTAFSEGTEKVVLEPQPNSLMETFDRELNSLNPHYPSVDEILVIIADRNPDGVRLLLDSTQISLEQQRISREIPIGTEISTYCFPSGSHPLNSQFLARENVRESNGSWPSYVELPELPRDRGDASYNWASKIVSSVNHIEVGRKHYIKVNVRKYKDFYLITLPNELLQIESKDPPADLTHEFPFKATPAGDMNPETTNLPITNLTIITQLKQAFIAIKNTKKRYGPFIVLDGKLLDEQSQEFTNVLNNPNFKIKNIIDDTLIPENFSNNGTLSFLESMKAMEDFIITNGGNSRPLMSLTQSFGTLEVAGLPRKEAFDGTIFPDGSFIDRISVNFDINGIKTIYYVKPKNIKSLPKEDKKVPEELPLGKCSPESPSKDEKKDPVINEPETHDPKENKLSDKENMEIIEKRGGLGQIMTASRDGYSVQLVSYSRPTTTFLSTSYVGVQNLAELEIGQGHLPVGTYVTVTIQHDHKDGPGIPTIEQTPQVFAPPLPEPT